MVYTSIIIAVCTCMYWSVMMFGLYSAGACCGWYLDTLWLCWMGVWGVQGCNACQMLPLQASKEMLSWREPTDTIHYISTYWNILVHLFILVFTTTTSIYILNPVLRGWAPVGVLAGHHCSGPTLSLQHSRWYRRCSLWRLLVCTPPAILQVPPASCWWTVP